jgi:hypothetical protein
MTISDWAALTLTVLSIVVLVAGGIRFLVKNYLSELKPDGNNYILYIKDILKTYLQ